MPLVVEDIREHKHLQEQFYQHLSRHDSRVASMDHHSSRQDPIEIT